MRNVCASRTMWFTIAPRFYQTKQINRPSLLHRQHWQHPIISAVQIQISSMPANTRTVDSNPNECRKAKKRRRTKKKKNKIEKRTNSRQYVSISISNAHKHAYAPRTHTIRTRRKINFSDSIMYFVRVMMNRISQQPVASIPSTHASQPSIYLDNRHRMRTKISPEIRAKTMSNMCCCHCDRDASERGYTRQYLTKCQIDFLPNCSFFFFGCSSLFSHLFLAFSVLLLSQRIRRNEFSCRLLLLWFPVLSRCRTIL